MLRKLKWIILGCLSLLAFIVCLQNLANIQLHFLFSTIELPQAVVLAVAILIGFTGGLLANALWKVHAWRARVSREKQQTPKSDTSAESTPQ